MESVFCIRKEANPCLAERHPRQLPKALMTQKKPTLCRIRSSCQPRVLQHGILSNASFHADQYDDPCGPN
jgi:hypothetical protein